MPCQLSGQLYLLQSLQLSLRHLIDSLYQALACLSLTSFVLALLDELSVASELLIARPWQGVDGFFQFAPGGEVGDVAWIVAEPRSGSHREAGLPFLKGGTRKEEGGVVRHFDGGTERAMVMEG